MEEKKLLVHVCESQTQWVVKDSIELNLEEYSELNDKSEEEIKDYISKNCWEMKAPKEYSKIYKSLGECLNDRDVIRDKEISTETHYYFD